MLVVKARRLRGLQLLLPVEGPGHPDDAAVAAGPVGDVDLLQDRSGRAQPRALLLRDLLQHVPKDQVTMRHCRDGNRGARGQLPQAAQPDPLLGLADLAGDEPAGDQLGPQPLAGPPAFGELGVEFRWRGVQDPGRPQPLFTLVDHVLGAPTDRLAQSFAGRGEVLLVGGRLSRLWRARCRHPARMTWQTIIRASKATHSGS
ncbi:MAG: hypothetical protein E6J29_03340 [Chloroflexi bacterium]|nr:MAG: hypothetical protein E6J29_03340 [Chloroflexota bacterium]